MGDSTAPSDDADPGREGSIAEPEILAVATTSVVAEVHRAKRWRGDWVVLTPAEAENARIARATNALAAAPMPHGRALMPQQADPKPTAEAENTEAGRIQGRIGF